MIDKLMDEITKPTSASEWLGSPAVTKQCEEWQRQREKEEALESEENRKYLQNKIDVNLKVLASIQKWCPKCPDAEIRKLLGLIDAGRIPNVSINYEE